MSDANYELIEPTKVKVTSTQTMEEVLDIDDLVQIEANQSEAISRLEGEREAIRSKIAVARQAGAKTSEELENNE